MRWLALLPFFGIGCDFLSPFQEPADRNVIQTGTIAPVSQKQASRLDQVGRQIISTNAFLGSAPLFGLVGTKEPEIYHPNAEAVFVSEGLVNRCPSDDVLAGVLCLEVARINCESRNIIRLGLPEPDTDLPGIKAEPDPEQADLGGAETVGGGSDPKKRLAQLPSNNAEKLAAEWHKSAGYKPEAFAQSLTLYRLAESGHETSRQLIGSGTVPRWTK